MAAVTSCGKRSIYRQSPRQSVVTVVRASPLLAHLSISNPSGSLHGPVSWASPAWITYSTILLVVPRD